MNVNVKKTLKPIKFCCFIKPEKESYKKAIELLCSLWAGIYSPILPFYETFPIEYSKRYTIDVSEEIYYSNILVNFDVDVIIYEDQLKFELINKIAKC